MGQTITKHATNTTEFPVTALEKIVREILSNGGNDNTLLCLVWNGTGWANMEAHNVINMVHDIIEDLKLHPQAIDHNILGAYLLCAGGAMALSLHGYDDTTKMKMGRWKFLTF